MKKFDEFLKEKGIATVESLDAEKLAGLYNEYNDLMRAEVEKAVKTNSDEVAALKEMLVKNQQVQIDQLNEALKAQGIAIAKFNSGGSEAPKTFKEQLKASLKANEGKLKAMKDGQKSEAKAAEFDFEIKAAGTMTFANVSGGNIPVEERLEGLDLVPVRNVRLLDVMAKRTTSSNVVSWVSQANLDGTAGQTTEGLAKNQIDFDLVVASEAVKKQPLL
jgi:hypothetical protein